MLISKSHFEAFLQLGHSTDACQNQKLFHFGYGIVRVRLEVLRKTVASW